VQESQEIPIELAHIPSVSEPHHPPRTGMVDVAH
jgi:hypothetical protein